MELSDRVLSLIRLDVQWKWIVQMLIDGSLSELGWSLLLRCFTFLEEKNTEEELSWVLTVLCCILRFVGGILEEVYLIVIESKGFMCTMKQYQYSNQKTSLRFYQ